MTTKAGQVTAAEIQRRYDEAPEHRVVRSDVYSCLSGSSEDITCSCSWSGRSTQWRYHAVDVQPLPAPPPARPISRAAARAAIYGERRRRNVPTTS
jgi:hypothetical protein